MFKIEAGSNLTLIRHCEQSEAIQTWATHLRLSLGCFAVARNDDLPVFTPDAAAPRCPSVNQAEPPERARAKPRFFLRFVCFQAFARRKSFPLCLADAAPPPWISDRDRAHRRPSSTLETDREPSDRERRRSRVAPSSSALGVPPARGPGSHKIKIPSAFSEFSRPCKAENFRPGRNADRSSPLPTHGPRRKRLRARAPTLWRIAALWRARGDARLVASI
jgi:hypothetical protein